MEEIIRDELGWVECFQIQLEVSTKFDEFLVHHGQIRHDELKVVVTELTKHEGRVLRYLGISYHIP